MKKIKNNKWSVAFYVKGGGWFSWNTPSLWRALFFALFHIGKIKEIRRLGR